MDMNLKREAADGGAGAGACERNTKIAFAPSFFLLGGRRFDHRVIDLALFGDVEPSIASPHTFSRFVTASRTPRPR